MVINRGLFMASQQSNLEPERMNVMLVEDSSVCAQLVREVLQPENVNLIWLRDAVAFQASFEKEKPDILILDIVLPGNMSGVELCYQVKQSFPHIQIMLMSGLNSTFDKVTGLESGADDYVSKPFEPSEFRARFRVLKRRLTKKQTSELNSENEQIQVGELKIYPSQRKVYLKTQELVLRRREFELLYYLVQHAGEVCSREELLNAIWPEPGIVIRTVDTHIQRLRQKLQDSVEQPQFIETLRGVGYRFCA